MPAMLPPTTQELWHLCQRHTLKFVAQKFHLTTQEMVARFRQEGLTGQGPKDPSPEEIERQRDLIRSRWDEATASSRWVGARGRPIR